MSARSARLRRSSSQSGKYDPCRSFGMETSSVPARVSKSRCLCPLRELARSSLRIAIACAAQAVCFCAHQRGDEGSEHRAQQVGARSGELVGQKLFGVDKVVIGHRVFSLQVELVALLKNHAVAVLIRVATRPRFQGNWSYTTLLDSTLGVAYDRDIRRASPHGLDAAIHSPVRPGSCRQVRPQHEPYPRPAHRDARGDRNTTVSARLSAEVDKDLESRWCSPIIRHKFDTTTSVRAAESRAIGKLGVRNLRRLQYHDPTAPGWRVIGRLLRPLEAVNAGLDSPPTAHRRRAMDDAIAALLTRCVEVGKTFWGWSTEEWIHLLGRDQAEFRRNALSWAGDEVRPFLAAHAYLLGSFTEFHQLGSFQQLTLSWRIFSREIDRVRKVLAEWGYRLGSDDDTLLPMVLSQLFLLNRSPHLDEFGTELFDRVCRDGLRGGARLNTVHAVQRHGACSGVL